MKEIIWFFGPSASGKKTLIQNILQLPSSLRVSIGINSQNIKANKEALEWVTKKNHQERAKLVDKIIDELNAETEISLLIKGQSFDLKNNLLDRLSIIAPDVKQKVVFVYIGSKEGLARLKIHRAWYTPDMTEDYVLQEINYQLQFMQKLKSQGVPIICLDGGDNAQYRIMDLPSHS